MARNPFKVPGLPKQPGMKVYNDQNVDKQLKLKLDSGEEFDPDKAKNYFKKLREKVGNR